MKKIGTFVLLMLFVSNLGAQDIIVLRDATEIESKVLEITETMVSYEKWSNQEGPTYHIGVEKILFIKFANGEKEVFNTSTATKPETSTSSAVNKETQTSFTNKRPFIKGARFHAYPYAGYYTYVGYWHDMGVFLTWSFGVRIFDYGYVGLASGIDYDIYDDYFSVPLLLNLRGYYPINQKVHPFVEFSSGYELIDGAYECHVITGFDIAHFTFGLGYYYKYGHCIGIQIGAQIGRKS